jgi:RND family efflux transporter MFP subunit
MMHKKPLVKRAIKYVIALGISGVLILASMAFSRKPPPPPAEASGMTIVGKSTLELTEEAPQWRVLRLDVASPATSHWTDPVPARIKIDERRAAKVGTPLSGRVTKVYVEFGQHVKALDPLFVVASPTIAELRAEQANAEVAYQVAKANLERVKAMVAINALPAKEELLAAQQAKEAEVRLRLASAKLKSLRVTTQGENEFTVTAPRDGVVVEKNVLPGQQVQPDADVPLLTIADLSSVWVVADLFEADATGVLEGSLAEVTSPSQPDMKVLGTVEMVSSVVDPIRHTVPVRVYLPNSNGLLKPNSYAWVRFERQPKSGAVEVPASALISDGRRQFVFVSEGHGRFSRREVVAGSATSGIVPILEGLKAGEVVVAEGAILLDNELALAQ